jgi:hypothetical protein
MIDGGWGMRGSPGVASIDPWPERHRTDEAAGREGYFI